jgi:hypothetical protein
MKKKLTLILGLVISLAGLQSCNESNEPQPRDNEQPGRPVPPPSTR